MHILAQLYEELAVDPHEGLGTFFTLHLLFLWGTFGLLSFVYTIFWLWMLIECIRSEPDRFFWIWLIVVVPFPGAIVYAVTRYYPTVSQRTPDFLSRWTRGRELDRLETAAQQIGNPHQFILWGDALREVGRWGEARDAYAHALRKDPQNVQALWGTALVAEHEQDHGEAERCTRLVLNQDPQYKFGDVYLAHGKALAAGGQPEIAREHLERHIQRWRHPEALYHLAVLSRDAGEPDVARRHLRSLLQDLNASPPAIARRHGRWRSRARQMLRKLPAEK
jgi:hypothetical protein